MSPVSWRVDNSGNVKGLIRRKCDPNPMNWGHHVDKKILNHPEIYKIKTNVEKPDDKEDKCKGCVKKEKKKKAKQDDKDRNSAGGCVVM
ncbi:hypothetical protein DID88_001509 [Monilinia fructigena]|uniref:Uncharacterized protein n=1 Tax=Monilinia fructigena TaxID=38457 RepID=A0A395IXB2_9HELO|nr:hypothetical protein DID88_001509 [Monilinia fructigena]